MNIEEFQKLIEDKIGGTRTKYCLKYLSSSTDNELMTSCIDVLIGGGYTKEHCTIHLISQFLSGTLKSKECPICHKLHFLRGLTCSPECRRLLHNNTCKKHALKIWR